MKISEVLAVPVRAGFADDQAAILGGARCAMEEFPSGRHSRARVWRGAPGQRRLSRSCSCWMMGGVARTLGTAPVQLDVGGGEMRCSMPPGP
jgi:hypothetical protein